MKFDYEKTTNYTNEYIEKVNRSFRGAGAVGSRAVVPRVVEKLAHKDDKILDYGAGKYALHARALRDKGFNVDAIDIGNNYVEGVHDVGVFKRKYNIVYASNVMNVQPSEYYLEETLLEIGKLLAPLGMFVGNYPASPRYSGMNITEVERVLKRYFYQVNRPREVDPYLFVCFR